MRPTRRLCAQHTLESLERRALLTAVAIDGMQPIALATPQLRALLRHTVGGAPLTDGFSFEIPNVLFNTASPGIMINSTIADALGVLREQVSGSDAVFNHNHSGGSVDFNVSELLDVSLARYHPDVFPDVLANYTQDSGLKYLEIGPVPDDSALNLLSMLGPEAIAGRVVVMDPRPVNTFDDQLRTYVYNPGTPPGGPENNPGIPVVTHKVQLSYGDYTRFTSITPGAANSPAEHRLVFVGPNPIDPTPPDTTPPVSFALGATNLTGSFLLDTAAATSMISLAKAASLGVTYKPGTFGTSGAALNGVAANQQFRLTTQSLDGAVTMAGFYLDTLALQSDAGAITFNHVPVLVGDAAVGSNSGTHQILDGVLGMNLFVASAALDSQGTLDHQTPGAFNWLTFDEPNKKLGLDVASLAAHPRVLSSSFDFQSVTRQSITFQFTSDVVLGPIADDLTLFNSDTGLFYDSSNTTIQVTYTPATHTAVFKFPSFPNGRLPDGNYTTSLFSGAALDTNGAGLGDDYTLAFWNYQGDANHDRAVNALDFNALASNFGGSGKNFIQGDFNYDGTVNSLDFNVLAGRFNKLFAGPDAPELLLAPGSALAPASGTAAPAPLAAEFRMLFSRDSTKESRLGDIL